jgi:hypothetical protein
MRDQPKMGCGLNKVAALALALSIFVLSGSRSDPSSLDSFMKGVT